jgi:hypothetical protein
MSRQNTLAFALGRIGDRSLLKGNDKQQKHQITSMFHTVHITCVQPPKALRLLDPHILPKSGDCTDGLIESLGTFFETYTRRTLSTTIFTCARALC